MHPVKLTIAKTILSTVLFFICLSAVAQTADTDLTQYANPLIGTKGLIFYYGRTTPFVTPPFGMTHWTACNQDGRIGRPLYQYLNTQITGFRGTHKPAMWMGDYGQVALMPAVGAMNEKKLAQKLFYAHHNEISKPYYYSLKVTTHDLHRMKVEMTATSRCGILRFTFPKTQQADLIVEAYHGWIKIDTAKREVTGWNTERASEKLGPPLPNFKGYFVIQYDKPFASWGTTDSDKIHTGNITLTSKACGAWVCFAKGTDTVQVRVGTSFISLEQARDNLEKEVKHSTFEQVAEQTKAIWNDYLGRIQIEGASHRDRAVFYSAMYHCLLFPRQFSEYGRYYSAFDDRIHDGVSYNDYSLWDTYRAEHPLLILIAPERVPGMVQSLVQMYEEGGYMPKWPNPTYTNIMIGTHADAVIADAVVKGIKGFDLAEAYKACLKDAMVPPDGDSVKRWGDRVPWSSYEARQGLTWYMKLGYVPVDKTAESVSSSLEYTYDDFCVAQVAKATGHMDIYDLLMKRSKNYVNLFNKATGFMAPRKADGTWYENTKAGFTEGSPWTYQYAAQHDIPGVIEMSGGRDKFLKKLNANFNGLRYVHENEPGHHFCYLYDYAGQAWMTQKRVAHFRRVKYRNEADGMDGDDDCGQMSAWYIFSALGFYPVTPGTDVYAIGTPLFPKATVYFDPTDKTKKFEIIAHHVSRRNKYVQSVTVNGRKLSEPFLHHGDIVSGGQMIFEMGPRPVK
jgi:predicted alpha-1,2-mannosidase